MNHPYREPGRIETDEQKLSRLRREYDMLAISAQTTPEADTRVRSRMREISNIMLALQPRPTPSPGSLIGGIADLFGMDWLIKDLYRR